MLTSTLRVIWFEIFGLFNIALKHNIVYTWSFHMGWYNRVGRFLPNGPRKFLVVYTRSRIIIHDRHDNVVVNIRNPLSRSLLIKNALYRRDYDFFPAVVRIGFRDGDLIVEVGVAHRNFYTVYIRTSEYIRTNSLLNKHILGLKIYYLATLDYDIEKNTFRRYSVIIMKYFTHIKFHADFNI